ncbi:MAG TPA: hypothetical protein DCL41_03870 [Bdellovibrionales bacterium]|nr:hypothetical protein [Pseudobdellovibrionaceae bacterium]HAG90980.1 hypothetical protein [Bdellovibrionales bacterium]|tara:strand:- start:108 stop:1067 length:960 start_codon:yes stop_codon:yes gene_type:complete
MSLKRSISETLSLPVEFLKSLKDPNLGFDIYVEAAGKPILYCRGNDVRLMERIDRLSKKDSLKNFLVVKEQYSEFIQYLSRHLENVFHQSKGQSLQEQVQAIYQQQKSLLVIYGADISSEENYAVLRNTCSLFYDFFSTKEERLSELFCHLELGEGLQEKWAAHSIRTAALGSRLISEMADEPGKPIFEVIQGAFLHDIAYMKSPWDFKVSSPEADLAFKEHPLVGYKMMELAFVSPWVRNTIRLHEEHVDGSGFPSHARQEDIDPTILCIAIASAFDHYITIEQKTPAQALKQILIDKMGSYPLEYLQKVQTIAKALG